VIGWLPTVRLLVEMTAWPPATGCTPRDVTPSNNSTLPVAALGEIVAVNVTLDPVADGVWLVTTVALVAALLIVNDRSTSGAAL
jgi:hypothetical protein